MVLQENNGDDDTNNDTMMMVLDNDEDNSNNNNNDDNDNKKISPMDPNYLDSLQEDPFWKTVADKVIPPKSSSSSSSGGDNNISSAVSRLDQLEIDVRSQLLNRFQHDNDSTKDNGLNNKDNDNKSYKIAGEFWKLAVNLCLHLVHFALRPDDERYVDMVPRKLPLLLIEDCLDILSVSQAQFFWDQYVEPALDPILLGDLLWESSNACHLLFLKVCNQFLKTFENATSNCHQEWKGRILKALAKAFAITDRSALKLWGSFHTANSTDYERKETFDGVGSTTINPPSHSIPAPATRKVTTTPSTAPIHYNLYHAFWSLQADFANPNRIQVADFIKKMKAVLQALESSIATTTNASSSSSSSTIPPSESIKYVTASSLLPTQLATPQFRSSVVSQFLIAASHLSSESPPLAHALAPLLTRAKKLLKMDHPELYDVLWDSILTHREGPWRQWKKNKCPPNSFGPTLSSTKPTPSLVDTTKTITTTSAKNSANALRNSRPLPAALLSAGERNVSSSTTTGADQEYESLNNRDELMQIAQESKKAIPTLKDHLELYVEALDPESGIEEEYHPGKDPLFAWRAMRLYAQQELSLLKKCRRPADLERITREWWYQSEGKEIPGAMPTPQDDSSSADDNNDDDDDDERSGNSAEDEGVGDRDDDHENMSEEKDNESLEHSQHDDHDDDAAADDKSQTDNEGDIQTGTHGDNNDVPRKSFEDKDEKMEDTVQDEDRKDTGIQPVDPFEENEEESGEESQSVTRQADKEVVVAESMGDANDKQGDTAMEREGDGEEGEEDEEGVEVEELSTDGEAAKSDKRAETEQEPSKPSVQPTTVREVKTNPDDVGKSNSSKSPSPEQGEENDGKVGAEGAETETKQSSQPFTAGKRKRSQSPEKARFNSQSSNSARSEKASQENERGRERPGQDWSRSGQRGGVPREDVPPPSRGRGGAAGDHKHEEGGQRGGGGGGGGSRRDGRGRDDRAPARNDGRDGGRGGGGQTSNSSGSGRGRNDGQPQRRINNDEVPPSQPRGGRNDRRDDRHRGGGSGGGSDRRRGGGGGGGGRDDSRFRGRR